MLKIALISTWIIFSGTAATSQIVRKVLFLGNSYTGVNNLPQLIRDVALSAGDTLVYDSHTPGGYTLANHALDPTTLARIMSGGWDYVVLQGQSQEPIIQPVVFNQGGQDLYALIKQFNPCAVPLLYITWGRKNGDAANCPFYPLMCTYAGMDSTLRNRYTNLASLLDAELSPVSVVWKYIRQNYSGIELYQADESHPSAAGSYAAACSFYAAIFKKDPALISFNYSLNPVDAALIRNAAKVEVFDQLALWDHKQLPHSGFQFTIGTGNNQVHFSAISNGAQQSYSWDLGDGNFSSIASPTHSYSSDGIYTVTLTTSNCDLDGLHTSVTDTVIQFCNHTPSVYTSNPWLCNYDTLWTQSAEAYQWYSGGAVIPETNQFIAHYQQYSSSSFSVKTTISGCTELSVPFNATPQWTGYYFDAAMGGDPCEGDTALFIVYHADGALSGTEMIRWFKDGIAIPAADNQDTLFIGEEGIYECFVFNPDSDCPNDTTFSSPVDFNCGSVGFTFYKDQFARVYPNPATDMLIVEVSNHIVPGDLQIYNTLGQLISVAKAAHITNLSIGNLPDGQYYIRLSGNPQTVLRFIKN